MIMASFQSVMLPAGPWDEPALGTRLWDACCVNAYVPCDRACLDRWDVWEANMNAVGYVGAALMFVIW